MEHTLKILSLLAVAMVLGISCVEEEQPEVKPEPVGNTVFLVGAKALSDEFELRSARPAEEGAVIHRE